MHDAFVVRRRQPFGDLDAELDGRAQRQRGAVQAGAQALPFEQLRDDVRRPVVAADVVDGEDVGVVERRGGARFQLEAAQAIGVIGEGRGEDLDGHRAPELGVVRPVHFAHAPGVHERDDVVAPQSRPGCE